MPNNFLNNKKSAPQRPNMQKPMPQKSPAPQMKKPDEGIKTELKLGYWFITHQLLLRKILTGILIGIVAIFWGYALFGLVDWAFVTGPKERQNLNTILDIKTELGALEAASAKQIAFGEVNVFAAGVGQYDVLVEVENVNDRWWAEFEYRFMGEGLEGEWKKGFILPEEIKYISDLGLERAFRPRNVRLETREFKYHRIDTHKIPDYESWRDERLNIVISEQKFDPRAIQNKKNIARLDFTATNNTSYDFWSIGFYALLYRGDQLVAVNFLSAEDIVSGEARELSMYFYEGLPTINKILILPELNIFDPDVYVEK